MKGAPLRHDFGSGEVAAYRWINADGIQRGIVAESARVDDTAFIGAGASIDEEAVIYHRAFIGDGARIGAGAIIDDGASIGTYARIGDGASIGYWAFIGDRAVIGEEATIGYRARIEGDDWYMAGGPCGSRKAMWTAVHNREHGLRWWVGCQRGITTDALLERVQETHGDNEHGRAYRHAILFVTTHPEYLRRVAAQADGAQP